MASNYSDRRRYKRERKKEVSRYKGVRVKQRKGERGRKKGRQRERKLEFKYW